jgi:hypothetical protein
MRSKKRIIQAILSLFRVENLQKTTSSQNMKRTVSEMMNDETNDSVSPVPVKTKKQKSKNTGRPRPPARPYKRVTDEVLNSRISEMEKKLDALQSKAVLMKQRFDMHVIERQLRQKDNE